MSYILAFPFAGEYANPSICVFFLIKKKVYVVVLYAIAYSCLQNL